MTAYGHFRSNSLAATWKIVGGLWLELERSELKMALN